jgi:hypothetical protein
VAVNVMEFPLVTLVEDGDSDTVTASAFCGASITSRVVTRIVKSVATISVLPGVGSALRI